MRINSIDRCFNIIELLSQHPQGGMRLSDISAHLGLNSSTVHHILGTLVDRDYVIQHKNTKRYALGFAFLEIGHRIIDNIDLRNIARPDINALHKLCGEAVHLSVLRGGKVIYIDIIRNPTGLSLATYIGFSTDPHAAAGGKALLAGISDDEVTALYAGRPFKRYTDNTCGDLKALMAELNQIRQRGYAIDNEEYYEGVRCVAAPIIVRGKTVASLSITGAVFTITLARIKAELAKMVMETAQAISKKMQ
ncbi:MAG: IclR family transcriptional regulator [Pseudomonadota bacterium]|nr:IclR family transcriptional regulator [Pseudomonadota bacterium]MBU1570255.1 IclR family transcriptional regulator [Pseudomonadota bacterium]